MSKRSGNSLVRMTVPRLALAVLALAALCLPLANAATTDSMTTVAPRFGALGTPRFDAYAADEKLRNAHNAGEPSVGVTWNTGHAFFQANSNTYRAAFDDNTTDANGAPKVTWTDVTPPSSRINVDPILHADHATNRVWAGGLDGACSILGFSDDDGATWVPTGNVCNFAQFDHESFGSGAWASDGLPRASLYPRAAYYCSQGQVVNVGDLNYPGTACITSLNGGLTWTAPAEVLGGCGGLHGHIRVDDVTGMAAVPDGSCIPTADSGDPVLQQGTPVQGFAYSTDNGVSWNSRVVQGSVSADGFDPSLAFTQKSGWLYYAQADALGVHVALSKDGGVHWEVLGKGMSSTDSGAAPPSTWLNLTGAWHDEAGRPLKYATFADVAAGDDERAAVTFLGTTTGQHPFDDANCGSASDKLVWYYFVAQTFDAGQTWSVTRLSDDAVQVGTIWNGGGNQACRNLLDFADMDYDAHGRLVVAFADGCTKTCPDKVKAGTAKGSDSRDSLATILRQTTGRGLFAQDDEPVAPATPPPTSTSAQPSPGASVAAAVAALAACVVLVRRRA